MEDCFCATTGKKFFVLFWYCNSLPKNLYNNTGMKNLFLENYLRFKDKIYNYFWYRVNFSESIAEDLTQEVFLKAFDKFDTFDQEKSFQAWIYAIAKNHLKNFYRVQGREVSLEGAAQLPVDTMSKIDAKMEWERILDKINSLPDKYREVLLLRHIDGLLNDEIADFLGLSEGVVRTRICRALKIIKEESINI